MERKKVFFLYEWMLILDPDKAVAGKSLPNGFKQKIKESVGLKTWTRKLEGDHNTINVREVTELAEACDFPTFLLYINPSEMLVNERCNVLIVAKEYREKQGYRFNSDAQQYLQDYYVS
jgi:hypothetical protein